MEMPQLMRTSNPALGEQTFTGQPRAYDAANRMSINGTINKTGILLVCAILTAGFTWVQFVQTGSAATVAPWMMLGMIVGFITAMVTIFKKEWAPVTAPIYALSEGLVLGGISAFFEMRYPGIAIEAVALTFGTLFVMLFLYRTRVIQATEKFRIGVFAATGAIALFYLLQMVLGFFHVQVFSSVYGSGLIGIGFSVFVVIIAALNLVLDFDFIERGAIYGAPKYMEWYGGFSLMVTLVWLYLEILRLLSKINQRSR
jgi:uncharacterized YccA/Bax inhibitor family protein